MVMMKGRGVVIDAVVVYVGVVVKYDPGVV